VTDSTSCNPQVIRRNYLSLQQAVLNASEFFAEVKVVRDNHGGLYALLECSDISGAPVPFYGPEVELTHRDERERYGLSFDVGAVKFTTPVALFVQVGEHISVEEKGVHAVGVSSSAFVGYGDEFVDVFVLGPPARELVRIAEGLDPLGFC
jgi:hypothetical protein